MKALFHFKQFSIQQERSAMKVGTDSILLGAWTPVADTVNRILDIGAGTGILSLMLAQRSNAETLDAVEIDPDAYEEAVTNFENSPWADRLFCYHSSIQELAEEPDEKYDLIIANPPYFKPSEIAQTRARSIARQTHLLNHITLLKTTKTLLNKEGACAFVIPFELDNFFINLAKSMGFYLTRYCRVKDTEKAAYKRSLLQFSLQDHPLEKEVLVLKNDDTTYSEAFKKLTGEFYLDF